MERLVRQAGDRVGGDDDPARCGQGDGVPPLLLEEPDHPEQLGRLGVVDAWFFLGW